VTQQLSNGDDERLVDLCFGGIAPFLVAMGGGAPDSRVIEHDAATALIMPSVPQRSLLNATAIDRRRQDELPAVLEQLAVEYAAAGVTNPGVWTVEGDHCEAALADLGWVVDSKPRAMGARSSRTSARGRRTLGHPRGRASQ
jgi:hypothetical protein